MFFNPYLTNNQKLNYEKEVPGENPSSHKRVVKLNIA